MWGDRDVYIKPQMKPNGDRYYEILLVYVDDILLMALLHNFVLKRIAFVPLINTWAQP